MYIIETVVDYDSDIFLSDNDLYELTLQELNCIDIQTEIDELCDIFTDDLRLKHKEYLILEPDRLSVDYNLDDNYVVLRTPKNSYIRCNFVDKNLRLSDNFYFRYVFSTQKFHKNVYIIKLLFDEI